MTLLQLGFEIGRRITPTKGKKKKKEIGRSAGSGRVEKILDGSTFNDIVKKIN